MKRVRRVERAGARRYLTKAEEFLRAASDALERDDLNAAGLGAIHAGISAADAYLVAEHGLRSAAPDHGESVRLLRELGGDAVKERVSALQRLLARKSVVEYEDRLFTTREARDALTRADRLVSWAREHVQR